jgi:hypothetical protein
MAENQSSFSMKSIYNFPVKRKLMSARYSRCSTLYVPPKPSCPKCASAKVSWEELRGKGKLATFTVGHVGPADPASETPCVVGIVELDEGPKVSCRILDVDANKPESIRIKTPMTVDFVIKREKAVPRFIPVV